MRTRIPSLFMALLVCFATLNPTRCARADDGAMSLERTWVGALEAQGAEFPMALTFEKTQGELSAELDIIASLSPTIEVTDLRVTADTLQFSLPLSSGQSIDFSGVATPIQFDGTVTSSESADVLGHVTLQKSTFESLPAWARGEHTWSWPDPHRAYWPTEDWRPVDPSSAGLNVAAIEGASQAIPELFPMVRALLVVRGGQLAWEEYFRGTSADESFNIKSASKVIITALAGVAIREGHISDADRYVKNLLPEYFDRVEDQRKGQIRLHHLLDMTTGLRWVENGRLTWEWAGRGHSSQFYVDLPLDCLPGHCFNYSTASTHLVSEIISRTTKMSTRAFSKMHIFDPIGAEVEGWLRGSNGVHIGGAEVFMTPRDMARLGLLFLSQGWWDGEEVVPAAWVHECTDFHSEGQPFVGSYGYGWWRKSIAGRPALLAKGYGGQFIVLVPAADLAVVVASDLSSPARTPALEHWICQSVVAAGLSRE